MSFTLGFYPKPHFIFWLEPKNEAKKFKTMPASLEKLTVGKLKSPNSSLRSSNSGYFYTFLPCFSAHRTRSVLAKESEIYKLCRAIEFIN